jgi:cell wall-associated NlpC family hydrolase
VYLSARLCVLALVLALAVPLGGAARATNSAPTSDKPRAAGLAHALKAKWKPKRRARPTLGERAARLALRQVGMPYVWGGAGPGGFDCSGLTSWAFGRLGVQLPHNAAAQYAIGRPVTRRRLRPGDLLFFHGLGHVGLYLGRGRMVHAPESGRHVEVVRLAGHYAGRLIGARRVAIS